MPYDAVVCNVMIASPNDVQEERELAREVIWEWNYLHSKRTGVILMPVAWETHSVPDMSDRPQAIINRQVLEDSDVLIGIFWTRLGTPTGQEVSGTVEEINEHVARGRPAMLYFSSAPVRPESVELEQLERLRQFKKDSETKGLIETYDSIGEFAAKLRTHLVRTVDDHHYFKELIGDIDDRESMLEDERSSPEVGLSREARTLLLEAAKDKNGVVMKARTHGGLIVQTNGKNMVTSRDARTEALWEDALNELINLELVAEMGFKGEGFRVTRRGFEAADLLRASG
jgi:hypothetical protein